MQTIRNTFLASFLLVISSTLATAQPIEIQFREPISAQEESNRNQKKVVVQSTEQSIQIDGQLNDATWQQAATIASFTPDAWACNVQVSFDDQNLYLAVRNKLVDGQKPVFKAASRDARVYNDDCIEIWISPLSTPDVAYQYVINADNMIYDSIIRGGGRTTGYNPQWQHATSVNDNEWIVEAAIPFSILDMDGPQAELGFNIGRYSPAAGRRSWIASTYGVTKEGVLQLHGAPPVPDAAAKDQVATESSSNVMTSGDALKILPRRSKARPGDRWIDIDLKLNLTDAQTQGARLSASLFSLAGSEAIAVKSGIIKPGIARISVDMREAKLQHGRLAIAVTQGDKQLAAASMNLLAEPTNPLPAGQTIDIQLHAPDGVGELTNHPVTFGVPFAAGTLWDVDRLTLVDNQGDAIPFQTEITGRWSRDGAIKWVRFDAVVSTAKGCRVLVTDQKQQAGTNTQLSLKQQGNQITIDTGAAYFVLGKGSSPIQEIRRGGQTVASAQNMRGLYVVDQRDRIASASAEGESMVIESRGPTAASIRFEGFYRTADGEELARHITRVECFAGQAHANITHTLVLCRDTNDVWFRDIGWEFAVEPGNSAKALFALSPEDDSKVHSIAMSQPGESVHMLQESHFVFAHGENKFKVASDSTVHYEGEECGDWAALQGSRAGLAFACRDAVRQHPKEFEVFADRIVMKLFSNRAGEELDFRSQTLIEKWDLKNWDHYSREEQLRDMKSFKSNAIGWSKTHQLQVSAISSSDSQSDIAREQRLHSDPLYALADPWWIYKSNAMGPNYPASPDRFPEVDRAQRAALDYWINVDRNWGENGFVDYNAGPHISYRHGRPLGRRYTYVTYQLRPHLWLAYTRFGDRRFRDFAMGTTRAQIDNIHMHWQTKDLPILPGQYRAQRGSLFGLPIYWGSAANVEISGSTNFNAYLWDYHLNGYRRGREVVETYGESMKKWWTEEKATRSWRILQLHKLIVQCYALTWDETYRDLAHATADLFTDPEAELWLTKERPYNSSTYKTQTDVRGLIDAWNTTHDPRYRELALRVSKYHWDMYGGGNAWGYNSPNYPIAQFLYNETGSKEYIQGTSITVKTNIDAYDPKTDSWEADTVDGAQCVGALFEIGTALDLIARTNADKSPVASWAMWNTVEEPGRLIIQKPYSKTINIHARGAGPEGYGDLLPPTIDALGDAERWGQDMTQIRSTSSNINRIHFAKDVAEWEFAINLHRTGPQKFIADQKLPLVAHVTGYWYPPSMQPAVKCFFELPEDSTGAAIFFEGSAKLFDPSGEPYEDGKEFTGWVKLENQTPGVWGFQPVENELVRLRNLPPYIALENRNSFFVPQKTEWQRQDVAELNFNLPASQLYGQGVSGKENDKAIHLTGERHLTIAPGGDHPSGDGSKYLPHLQGTIEYWIKPKWSGFDLPDQSKKWLIFGRTKEENVSYTMNYQVDGRTKEVFAMSRFNNNGEKRGIRTFRRNTLFTAGEWTHVAMTWGKGHDLKVFVNGKAGIQSTSLSPVPYDPFAPMYILLIGSYREEHNIDGLVDQLRISDVVRYTDDFSPKRTDRFELDDNTRLLLSFDGEIEAADAVKIER